MTQRISIIGAGKLARCFVLGLLKKGYNPELITVIYRSNYDKLQDININFSKSVPENTDVCIHMVRPQDVGELFIMINNRIDFFNSLQNIFFISGLTSDIVKNFVGLKEENFIIGTTNTNIERCEGIIVLSNKNPNKDYEFLNSLGSIIYTEAKNILEYVTIVGSGNAPDILFTKFLLEQFPMANFNLKLKEIKKCLDNPEKKMGSCCEIVDEYLLAKTLAIKEVLSWSKKDAEDIAYKTFVSTLNFFDHESIITLDMIEHHLKTVVTPKGCTAEGLSEIKNGRDFRQKEKIKLFYVKVSDRANKFEQDILASIAESLKLHKYNFTL